MKVRIALALLLCFLAYGDLALAQTADRTDRIINFLYPDDLDPADNPAVSNENLPSNLFLELLNYDDRTRPDALVGFSQRIFEDNRPLGEKLTVNLQDLVLRFLVFSDFDTPETEELERYLVNKKLTLHVAVVPQVVVGDQPLSLTAFKSVEFTLGDSRVTLKKLLRYPSDRPADAPEYIDYIDRAPHPMYDVRFDPLPKDLRTLSVKNGEVVIILVGGMLDPVLNRILMLHTSDDSTMGFGESRDDLFLDPLIYLDGVLKRRAPQGPPYFHPLRYGVSRKLSYTVH
jgi:hypothetical protein